MPGEPDKYYPTGMRNYARVVRNRRHPGPGGRACASKSLGLKKVFVLNDKQTYGFGVATTFTRRGEEARHEGRRLQGLGREAVELRGARERDQGDRAPTAVFLGGIICNNGAKLMQDLKAACPNATLHAAGRLQRPESNGAVANGAYISVAGQLRRAPDGRGQDVRQDFGKQIGADAEPVLAVRRTGDARDAPGRSPSRTAATAR